LGDLKCAISVPLNGRHKTYGCLEVINKMTNGGEGGKREERSYFG